LPKTPTERAPFAPAARAIASAEADSHRAALALTQAQRDFIEKRNASFGRHGYDLRQAMAERLDKLNTIARP
jgi:hypothetical protein